MNRRIQKSRVAWVCGAAVWALGGCGQASLSVADEDALRRAGDAAQALIADLQSELLAAVANEGPAGAAEFCVARAQPLTDGVGAANDATVGRSSLRLRNPSNFGPKWVATWLQLQGERPAEGVESFSYVADEGGKRVARVVMPIAVRAPCMACHGPSDQLGPGVAEVLAANYPEDAATGYAEGDLRGGVWAEVDVAPLELQGAAAP